MNFNTLGDCTVEIKNGAFGRSAALTAEDWDLTIAPLTDTVGWLPNAHLNG
jgi:hypothetical protein